MIFLNCGDDVFFDKFFGIERRTLAHAFRSSAMSTTSFPFETVESKNQSQIEIQVSHKEVCCPERNPSNIWCICSDLERELLAVVWCLVEKQKK